MTDRPAAARRARMDTSAMTNVHRAESMGVAWMAEGACRDQDTNLFFPPQGDSNKDADAAKAVCAGCPVKVECLEYALAGRIDFGVWGGVGARERARILRRRRVA